jgi:MipA family protein
MSWGRRTRTPGFRLAGATAAGLVLGLLSTGAAEAREWVVSVGAKGGWSPPYEGADHTTISPAPKFSIHPAKSYHRFSPPGDGNTVTVIDTRYFEVGGVVRFRRSRGETGDLTGFDKVQWAAEPGGFVNLWITDYVRTHVEVRHGVFGHKGFVADAGLDLVYSGDKWDFSVGPRVGWGDDEYMNTYFGVTPLEAARSPLVDRAFALDEGRRYTGVNAGAAYRLDDHWRIGVGASYRRLADRISASPVIQVAGDRNQYSGTVSLSYSFTVGH